MYKLKQIKFYQGVKVGTKTVASVQLGDRIDYEGTHKAEFEEHPHGILIKWGKHATLGTFNNIQYAQYEEETEQPVVKNLEAALKKQTKSS